MTKGIPKKGIKIDGGRALLVAAALVQGAQYAQAFMLVHSALGKFALAGGGLAGLVVVGAIAYSGNNLPRVRAKAAKSWGTVFFIGTLVLSPLVLTPVNWYMMDAALRASIGWYAWVLAGLVASLPELALGLVALVDRSLLSLPATSSVAQPSAASLSAGSQVAQRRSASKPASLGIAPAKLYRCECGYTDADRFVMSGHKRACAIYKQKKSGQPIPVEIPVRHEAIK